MTAAKPRASAGTPVEVVAGRRGASWTDVKDWVALSGAPLPAIALYQLLCMHLNRKRGDTEVWPTTQTLALMLGLGRADKVSRYIKVLVDLKAIDVRKMGLPARYRYTVHQEPPPGYTGPTDLQDWYDANRQTVSARNEEASEKRSRQRDAAKTRPETGSQTANEQVNPVAPSAGRQAKTAVALSTGRQETRRKGVTVTPSGGVEPTEVQPTENPSLLPPFPLLPDPPPAAVTDGEGGIRSEEERARKDQLPEPSGEPAEPLSDLDEVIAQVLAVRSEWSRTDVGTALAAAAADRPMSLVAAMMLRLAADPATRLPSRLTALPQEVWTREVRRAQPAPAQRREWCGDCDHTTRLVFPDDGPARRCDRCHPALTALGAA